MTLEVPAYQITPITNWAMPATAAANSTVPVIPFKVVKAVLIDIWDDRDFIISMLSIAEHDDDKRTIIEFIDAGIDVDVETVSVLPLDLADERDARQS